MDLIARDRKSYGCFALKIKHGKHLVELKRRLNKIVGYKGVEFITISRPTAYGEYAPCDTSPNDWRRTGLPNL